MANYTIDCEHKTLGRVASEIAIILQGKKNPTYDPRLEGDDTVTVLHIDQLVLTGRKEEQKIYYSHTTQIGHLKERKIKDVIAKHGKQFVLRHAVQRMLPKNKLQIRRMKRIIFA
jgi:large subunit ribosomal protein L13